MHLKSARVCVIPKLLLVFSRGTHSINPPILFLPSRFSIYSGIFYPKSSKRVLLWGTEKKTCKRKSKFPSIENIFNHTIRESRDWISERNNFFDPPLQKYLFFFQHKCLTAATDSKLNSGLDFCLGNIPLSSQSFLFSTGYVFLLVVLLQSEPQHKSQKLLLCPCYRRTFPRHDDAFTMFRSGHDYGEVQRELSSTPYMFSPT